MLQLRFLSVLLNYEDVHVPRSLYQLLASPGICPYLQELSVDILPARQAEGTPPDLQLDMLSVMATARAQGGQAIDRLRIQPCVKGSNLDITALGRISRDLHDLVGIEHIELQTPGTPLTPFEPREIWRAEGDNRYWGTIVRPYYILPWEHREQPGR